MIKGWILYKKNKSELDNADHGVIQFLDKAATLDIQLEVYKPEEFDLILSSQEECGLFLKGERCALPDFILPRLGADTHYHAMTIIKYIESLGVYCVNSAQSIDNVRDKMQVSRLLAQHQLPFPKTMLLKFPATLQLISQEIGFPLVIKTLAGMRGIGVCLCETESAFNDLVGVLSIHNNQKPLILQQFIGTSYGRDLRVFVLDGEVIGCMKRTAKNSFKANFSMGGDVEPYPVNDEIRDLSIRTAQLFGLDIAGIDLLFAPKGFMVCEANSSPGFKGMELVTNDDIASKILLFIKRKLEENKK